MKLIQNIRFFDETTGEIRKESKSCQGVREDSLTKQVESNVVGLYPEYLFQEIEGFGCALTETSCYLLSKMTEEDRVQIAESKIQMQKIRKRKERHLMLARQRF